MVRKLSAYAQRCTSVSETLLPEELKRRFSGGKPPRCIALTSTAGKATGLVLATDPSEIFTDFLSLERTDPATAHVAALSRASQTRLKIGALLTRHGMPQSWVPPEALTHWLGKMAQLAHIDATKKAQAVVDAQEQSLMFLANISHELRTPLNAVIGYADLIRHQTFGPIAPAQYGEYINSIHQSGEHLMNSINALLNLARIDAGAVSLEEEEFSVEDLMHQAVQLIQTEADQLDVHLHIHVPQDFPLLMGDPQLLRQALLNLISNAVKFSPPGAGVRITAARTARSGVRITVGDKGPGIPDKELPRIILPFKQAMHGPGRTGTGTGLGLSLAKAFIELHEGRLHLLSQEGKGTRAILTLPSGRVRDQNLGFQNGFAFVRKDIGREMAAHHHGA
ncbi:MAG: HAMP domain-containing sensor histidine kinase [Pseudomonadota bacterium]